MDKKPLILLTNDDGFRAKGILELIEALKDLGELVVVAPDGPRSGMSSAITSLVPIRYQLEWEKPGVTVYSCTGTPADCVKLAAHTVLNRQPDLVIAGINHGGNMAICVNYSGTMGAVAEGCIIGVPSIGISLLDHRPDADFTECCRLGRNVVKHVLNNGLPHGTYLNLNVPVQIPVKGLKICRQADGRWVKEYREASDASNKPVYWLTGYFRNDDTHEDNDDKLLNEGYATLVPCKVDVTDYAFMQELENWNI